MSGLSKFLSTANKVKKRVDERRAKQTTVATDKPQVDFDESFKKKDGVGYGTIRVNTDIPNDWMQLPFIYRENENILKGNQGILNLYADADSDYLQVDNIFIPEELRGTGIKEAFYNKALQVALDNGYKGIKSPREGRSINEDNFWSNNSQGLINDADILKKPVEKELQYRPKGLLDEVDMKWGGKQFTKDPNRAYTDMEFLIEGDSVGSYLSDAAHTWRGGEGYKSGSDVYSKVSKDDFKDLVSQIPYQNDSRVISQYLLENVGHNALIDYMDDSKYILKRPLYIQRSTGIRGQDSAIGGTRAGSVYSAEVIDPNHPNFDAFKSDWTKGGADTRIIRLPKGTTVYHPGGQADAGEVVVKGESILDAIDNNNTWTGEEFNKLKPEDVVPGTDWFSSLGLMNNIA